MGIFRKKASYDPFAPTLKDTMKMLGVEPGPQMREVFGWTENDDIESQEVSLGKMKRKLSEMKASSASLREVMELEISIQGTENWLKQNKPA